MKLMIGSDIHGSAVWCERFLRAAEKEGATRILLLGDILYHGPRNDLPEGYAPKEVIAMLNPLGDRTYSVRGNCEAEVDQMVLDFPVLADYCLLPLGEHMIYATHGHVYNEKRLPPMQEGDILLHGHTHLPRTDYVAGHWILNPGSVSIPKGGTRHSYATLDTETGLFTLKRVEDGETYAEVDLNAPMNS